MRDTCPTPVAVYAILLVFVDRFLRIFSRFAVRLSFLFPAFLARAATGGDRRAGTLLSPISSKLLYTLILIETRRGRERHVQRTTCRVFAASLFTRSLHAMPLISPSSLPFSGDTFPALLVMDEKRKQKVSTSCRRPHVFPMRGPLVRSRYK